MNAHSLNGHVRSALTSLLVLMCISRFSAQAGEQPRTLQSFGVQVKHGQPVYPLPNNVALGLFNPDPLLDLAYYADGPTPAEGLRPAGGKVQVWQNLGNGTFGSEPVFERSVAGKVEKMQWRMRNPYFRSPSDLLITYTDGREETIANEWMSEQTRSFASLPQMTSSFPPIDFREVWRSESQTQPTRFMAISDLDNDGHIEIAYAFYRQFSDSSHFVVYRSVSDDSFVIAWDSIIVRAYGPFAITDIDNDGHKELVLGRSVQGGGQLVVIECLGVGQYKFYQTNVTYSFPPFKVIEADIDHNGRKELVLHTSNPSAPPGQDATFIYVAEFSFKGIGSGGATMFFSNQLARYGGYTFDMAVGQIDGTGRDEIIPSGGSFGFREPVPIDYLWFNGTTWVVRQIHTGLESGTTAEMFVNLDADTSKELFIGGVGPVGHGSCYALDYVSDTTWNVLWADSSLRNTPLSVNAGLLGGQFILAGANTWDRSPSDTLYTDLNVYQPSGRKLGVWRRDTASIQNFHILDIDHDGTANLVTPLISHLIPKHLAVYEFSGTSDVIESRMTDGFELSQNYPNPFNPMTTFLIRLPVQSNVRVTVYDILGKEVNTIFSGEKTPGTYTLLWDGTNGMGTPVGSGVYFVRMMALSSGETYTNIRKTLLLR